MADVDLAALLPESPRRAYDVHPLINGLLDEGSTVELHARWAPNVTIALGRLGGRTVGVIANNPLRWEAAWIRSARRRRPGSSGCATRSGCRWS